MIILGILDRNIGEPLVEDATQPTFLMPNVSIETVLTGEVWKVMSINLDLENVGIELLNNHLINFDMINTEGSRVTLERDPLAHLAFLKSSLTYESYSDQSKLIDLVSSEILIADIRNKATQSNKNKNDNLFRNILCNPNSNKSADSVKRLQLELHYRSKFL